MPINIAVDEEAIAQQIIASVESSYPAPRVSKVLPPKIATNQFTTVDIYGSFFTPNMTLTASEDLAIQPFQFISDNQIRVTLNGSRTGLFEMRFNNGKEFIYDGAISVIDNPWIDLRSGNSEINLTTDIVLSNNLQVERKSEGIAYKRVRAWRTAAAFERFKFTRGNLASLEIIFNNTNTGQMIGVGKNPRNVNSSAQYYEAEIVAYIQNFQLYSIYGNRTRIDYRKPLDRGVSYLKLKFTDDIVSGSNWYLYGLNSDNWDDESYLIFTDKVSNRFELTGAELFPIVIPRGDSNLYTVALRVF